MFKVAKDEEIGNYLRQLISKKGYSQRYFGELCLKEKGESVDETTKTNMANRLSQMIKGKKAVQLDDLPAFTKLLGASCEEILSAGKHFAAFSNRQTHYSVATSTDRSNWEAYIAREDQIILNADEYGKTLIDYALEFGNYDLLKFLMDNKYIWFVGTDETDLFHENFGAGTSIDRAPSLLRNMNLLDAKMKERYDLRMKMIVLAIKNEDRKMLTELRAREIPSLYQACYYSFTPAVCDKYFDDELIIALAGASDEILEFFSEEFTITDRCHANNRFIFPFAGKLIDALLERGNAYAEWVLKDAIAHNRYALDKLTALLTASIDYYKDIYKDGLAYEHTKNDIIKGILQDLHFYDDGNLVCYRAVNAKDGIITNLVQVTAASDDTKTNRLIKELNELYSQIQNIKPFI